MREPLYSVCGAPHVPMSQLPDPELWYIAGDGDVGTDEADDPTMTVAFLRSYAAALLRARLS